MARFVAEDAVDELREDDAVHGLEVSGFGHHGVDPQPAESIAVHGPRHRVTGAEYADAPEAAARRLEHETCDGGVVPGVERRQPAGHRDRIERDARMVVLADEAQGLAADGLIAERGALRAAGHDADVLHQLLVTSGSSTKLAWPGAW